MSTRGEARSRSNRGGKREGAGRKRSKQTQTDPRHETRPALDGRHPVHAILRTATDVPRLRQRRMYEVIRRVLAHYVGRADFRIVHISIQHNHLHLLVEAANEDALTSGMASFAIRAARAINKACGRAGKVFPFRYNAKQITTRDYARNAISYVLNNWRKHREDERGLAGRAMVFDPYSSAASFNGWIRKHGRPTGVGWTPLPVSPPRTSLLRDEWEWFGLFDPFEVSTGGAGVADAGKAMKAMKAMKATKATKATAAKSAR